MAAAGWIIRWKTDRKVDHFLTICDLFMCVYAREGVYSGRSIVATYTEARLTIKEAI